MTTDLPVLTRWRRAKRSATLRLTDGRLITVERLPTGGWSTSLDQGEEIRERLRLASGLDVAISVIESVLDIPGWTRSADGGWTRDMWEVRKVEGEEDKKPFFRVYRDGERASLQYFSSADQGRAWVESRLHRNGRSLFGRNFRAEGKATVSLPIVRVTPEEKLLIFEVVKSHGITYSEFVRLAALFFKATDRIHLTKEEGYLRFRLSR